MSKKVSEDIKGRLFVETYNISKREELISDIAYLQKADQMLVFRISGFDKLLMQDCGYVTNEHLEYWGISLETLEEAAWENTMTKRPPVMVEMDDVLCLEFTKNLLEDDANILEGVASELQRFVLTNMYFDNGAIYMWHEETMQKVADKLGGNVAITPVSVDGLAVYLEDDDCETFELERINLRQLNCEMEKEDFLSNEVYRYDREKKEIEIVPECQQSITFFICM